jgi:hypothetical protein
MKFKNLTDKNKYYEKLLLPEFKILLPENSKSSFNFHYNKFEYLCLRENWVINKMLLDDNTVILLFKTYLKTKYNIPYKKQILKDEKLV